MDPLLFLCNLHAEGPSTVRLLRSRGVRTLADLGRLSVERLAELLGSSPAAARRFAREAQLALARAALRDLEEGVTLEPVTAETWLPKALPEPRERPAVRASVRLASWQLDEIAPRAAPPSTKIAPPLRPASTAGMPSSPKAPTAPLGTETLLRAELLPGLDARTCEKLVAEGIRTLGQLSRVPPARLAPLLGTSVSFLERLCALAANALGAERVYELQPQPRREPPRPVWSPGPLPQRTRTLRPSPLEDVAGPFAG